MFSGRRRRSSNVRVMQLFHELKQQFPTVPDHVITSCIASHTSASSSSPATSSSTSQTNAIRDILETAAAASIQQQDNHYSSSSSSMGHLSSLVIKPSESDIVSTPLLSSSHPSTTTQTTTTTKSRLSTNNSSSNNERKRFEMNESDDCSSSDYNRNIVKSNVSSSNSGAAGGGGGAALYTKKFDTVSVNTAGSNDELPTLRLGNSSFFVKRPDHLDLKPEILTDFNSTNRLRPSEKCKDVHKLLHSNKIITSDNKPPRSPSSVKRLTKTSPTKTEQLLLSSLSDDNNNNNNGAKKKETTSTPTQTTDTLLLGISPNNNSSSTNNNSGGSVNLSLNVNCSMDLVQSPTTQHSKRTTMLQMTPQQPWLQDDNNNNNNNNSQIVSPRSYTSVNLTLRPPSVERQPPIDITSQNSSLTYSTSSFDSQKGLQSRFQITVGPSGGGSVASLRTRPRSSYHPNDNNGNNNDDGSVLPVRTGSLNDLAVNSEPPVILKQQARIERLRIELKTEKANLIVMQKEVSDLENNRVIAVEQKTDKEIAEQLLMEIKHLRCQCEQLSLEVDKNISGVGGGESNDRFYQNIYTGQRGPLTSDFPTAVRMRRREELYQQYPNRHNNPPPLRTTTTASDFESSKWNCPLCTFLNHPDLDKCEQCDMAKIVHVSAAPGDNIHIHVTPRLSRRVVHSWVL